MNFEKYALSKIANFAIEVTETTNFDMENEAIDGWSSPLSSSANSDYESEYENKKKRVNSEVDDWKQTAKKSLDLMNNYIESKKAVQSKEECFGALLISELKQIKSEESYDNLTLNIYKMLVEAKETDRQEQMLPLRFCSASSLENA